MDVREAQREIHDVYWGGGIGALVSAAVWAVSTALTATRSESLGRAALFIGGAFIFPGTMLALRLLGRRASMSHENPLGALATQIAFTVPAAFPLAFALALFRPGWFYPAALVIVGAHYLPFIFLYGRAHYGVLAGVMAGAGLALGLYRPREVALGGWIGAGLFVVFGAYVLMTTRPPAARA